jgi:hypothetical protein
MMHGRLQEAKAGIITLRGKTGEGAFERKIAFDPANAGDHEALPSLWARAKVNHLTDARQEADETRKDEFKAQITSLAVQYHLMTAYTRFVAVDEKSITSKEPGETVPVQVETPDGVNYGAVFGNNSMAGGTLYAQAGDPLINVQAPADAAQVIALLPGGEIKRLVYIERENRWQARFDIPTYAPEGEYIITVVIVKRDGTRRLLTLRYEVDETAPHAKGIAKSSRSKINLRLDAGSEANRVIALLPWGAREELKAQNGTFSKSIIVPSAWRKRAAQVTFVITDRAHNRTMITVDMEK